MATVFKIPSAATPAERLLSNFTRGQLAGFIEVAIGILDLADGDPDIEANGDEMDGGNAEDEIVTAEARWRAGRGPGCPIADPDLAVVDSACDGERWI